MTATTATIYPKQYIGRQRFTLHAWWSRYESSLLLLITMPIVLFTHAINMGRFPYFENDEGIYMAQAWAVLTGHGLAEYTYWYDHPPFGWIQIAAWVQLTHGFYTFGPAVASGRLLMLLFHLGSAALLFELARKISKNAYVGVAASLIYSLSPLTIYFHRRVHLDNIMTFWLLASMCFIICRYKNTLGCVVLSAMAFSSALLSKEIAIFFVPALLYMVWVTVDYRHRGLAVGVWLAVVTALSSTWIVYAILKGELFPTGTFFGGNHPHVSMLETAQFQLGRGNGAGIFSLHNDFWESVRVSWLSRDPINIIAGMAATALATLLGFRYRSLWLGALPSLCMLAFLMRGGLVIDYYILPALPFFALNIALICHWVLQRYTALISCVPWRTARTVTTILVSLCWLFSCIYTVEQTNIPRIASSLYREDQASAQFEAIQWIEKNLPRDAFILMDHYGWLELHANGFTKAHYYWKVDTDTDVSEKILHGNWANIDYLLVTGQVATDFALQDLKIGTNAYAHSTLIRNFDSEGGGLVEVRRVNQVAISDVTATSVKRGDQGKIEATIEANILGYRGIDGANLIVEVHARSGETIAKLIVPNQHFAEGETRHFVFRLALPDTDLATTTIYVGAFTSNFTGPYAWEGFPRVLDAPMTPVSSSTPTEIAPTSMAIAAAYPTLAWDAQTPATAPSLNVDSLSRGSGSLNAPLGHIPEPAIEGHEELSSSRQWARRWK